MLDSDAKDSRNVSDTVSESGMGTASSAAGRKRRHRRVTAYSRLDRERLKEGKMPLSDEPVLSADADTGRFQGNDERLLANIPPHYGE